MSVHRKKPKPKVGRPSPYTEDMPERAYVLCRDAGITHGQLAKAFGVSRQTINVWKHEHPEFSDKIKAGLDEFRTLEAEQCLAKRVKGFTYDEVTKERIPIYEKDKDGKRVLVGHEMVETKRVKKSVAPDVGAIAFTLKNRASDRWKDKREVEVDFNESVIDRIARGRKRANGEDG
jgi:hypothetical protein